MKKAQACLIFASILLLNFFYFPYPARAASYNSCCVCVTESYSGGMAGGYHSSTGASTTVTDGATCATMNGPITKCSIAAAPECGEVATKEMTKIEDELFKFQNVVLGVTIPGLTFSPPPSQVDTEGNIYLPWLAQYLKAVYNYSVIVISILAVIMIIIQSIRIITSAGGPAKADAYKKITQIIIGLFIAWGSYTILYTINPGLTAFNPLAIQFIKQDVISSPGDFDVGNDTIEAAANPTVKGKGCRIAPPSIYAKAKTDLKLDRINIKGEDETKCPNGLVYPRDLVDAVLEAQKQSGVPAGFLLAQAHHEAGASFLKAGKVTSQLWGRKCPREKISATAGKDVWQDSHPNCKGARDPSAKNDLQAACEAAGCQVLSTDEWCPEDAKSGGTPKYHAWACFNKVDEASITDAAVKQGIFYRDTIGKFCTNCGGLVNYEGSVTGFAARMSCVLFGGVHNDKWDNCLMLEINKNCLEDSKNTDMLSILDKIGIPGACLPGGKDADASIAASEDPYDCAVLGCSTFNRPQ